MAIPHHPRDVIDTILEARHIPRGTMFLTSPPLWPDPEGTPDYIDGWWSALRAVAGTGTVAGLTPAEHDLIAKVGDVAADFMDLVGEGDTAVADWMEILPHLHALQQAVMSQAAGRVHPDRYRLLGNDSGGVSPRVGQSVDDD